MLWDPNRRQETRRGDRQRKPLLQPSVAACSSSRWEFKVSRLLNPILCRPFVCEVVMRSLFFSGWKPSFSQKTRNDESGSPEERERRLLLLLLLLLGRDASPGRAPALSVIPQGDVRRPAPFSCCAALPPRTPSGGLSGRRSGFMRPATRGRLGWRG